jgi:lysyl-tRNA synthetase class 2
MEHLTEISRWRAPNDARPEVTERFELLSRDASSQWPSELNDAEEQADRFNARW